MKRKRRIRQSCYIRFQTILLTVTLNTFTFHKKMKDKYVLGNKCAGQHNLKKVQIREIVLK
jgi:hypothetical protein